VNCVAAGVVGVVGVVAFANFFDDFLLTFGVEPVEVVAGEEKEKDI
jgi:hypothetical protein